jgi:predicted phosphodiesterase
MKYAVLADIHANLTALEAVLEDISQKGGADGFWSLGDLVGYGPDPSECIALAQKLKFVSVAGNHDWAAIGKINTREFNRDADFSARWTTRQLDKEDRRFLDSLPLSLEKGDFTLVHGSPREPIWEYVLSSFIAKTNLAYFKTPYCLIGHSHLPQIYECDEYCLQSEITEGTEIHLRKNRIIINPGGIGQPRDGDPRSSYAIYDSETGTIAFYRVEYDIRLVQERMKKKGLPEGLISRLRYGM